MPALGIVEWNDVPFTGVSCDFSKMSGIFHLTYFESREPSPRTLELENQLISTTISSSAGTLLYLTMPGRRALPTVLSDCFLPALRTLILTGFAPRTHESPLYQFLPQMPNLQNLQTRLCLGPPFEIYPHTDNDPFPNFTKPDLPLHSLTMYNTVPTDQILHNLPSTLQYLSLAQHPYPYEIIKEHGHKFPRLILNSKVSYLNRPKLTTTDILQHLQYCNLNALRELRLAVSGILLASWFLDLSLALPELETLELHYWHPRMEEKIPSIVGLINSFYYHCSNKYEQDHYAPAFSAFNKLRDLRLDLHLTDEVDHCADESCKAESQLSRAKKIAQHAPPFLKTIGFLEGHARIMVGGTANPTIFWRIFNIVPKYTSTSCVELLVRQSGDFRLYRRYVNRCKFNFWDFIFVLIYWFSSLPPHTVKNIDSKSTLIT